jgi:hypothetical protein
MRAACDTSPKTTLPNRSPISWVSIKTVERYRADLLQELGLPDRLELMRYAIRAGLIEP